MRVEMTETEGQDSIQERDVVGYERESQNQNVCALKAQEP